MAQVFPELRESSVALEPDWAQIAGSLTTVLADGSQRTLLGAAARWTSKILRYAFPVSPAPVTNGPSGGRNGIDRLRFDRS